LFSRALFMAVSFSVTTEALSTRANLAGPWRLTLVTNPDDCNLACAMCACGAARAVGTVPTSPRRMAPALAAAVLDERRGTALAEVIPSTLGEPLLWAGLPAVLARCAAHGLRVNVTTNGTFPGRGAAGWAEALVPVASDVKISWNGATAATAERIMAGLAFEAAVENVRAFVGVRDRAPAAPRRATVSFQVTAQERNVDELAGIVRLAARLGVDRVKLNHLQIWTPDLAAGSLRRSAEAIMRWNAAVRAARAAAEEERLPSGARVVLQNALELSPDPAAPAPRGPCPFLGREAWIHPDGLFAPCPHPATARGELGAFGAVGHATLGELWESAGYRAFVAGYEAHPVCQGCSFRRPGGA
jgi:MoaA/NifB/PqqE/SkfB family radical SAM enzyme